MDISFKIENLYCVCTNRSYYYRSKKCERPKTLETNLFVISTIVTVLIVSFG